MNQVLITGGAGYLGSVLCAELLSGGHSVRVLDSGARRAEGLLALIGHPRFQILFGDIRDDEIVAAAVQGCSTVIHLAGLVGQPACDENPDLARDVSISGTQTIVSALKDDQWLFFASSASVYGSVAAAHCDESTVPNPVSLYARLKLEGEQIVLGRKRSLVFRPATLYGPSGSMRYDLLPHQMMRDAIVHREISVFEPQRVRSFMHVRDAASSLVHLLRHISSDGHAVGLGRIVNLADPAAHVTKAELARLVSSVAGAPFRVLSGYTDPDLRDYRLTSSAPIMSAFTSRVPFVSGLRGVERAVRLCGPM